MWHMYKCHCFIEEKFTAIKRVAQDHCRKLVHGGARPNIRVLETQLFLLNPKTASPHPPAPKHLETHRELP